MSRAWLACIESPGALTSTKRTSSSRQSVRSGHPAFDFKRTGGLWPHHLLVVRTVAAEQALEEPFHAAAFKACCNSAIASMTASKGGGSPKIMALMAR